MSDLLHAFKRWLWARVGRPTPGRCADCGSELTAEESYYYGHTCELCEVINFHRWTE